MSDRSRLIRLITLALASCVVTWALAGSALARPDTDPHHGGSNPHPAGVTPAFKDVAGDTGKGQATSQAPAFNPVAGDTAKTPDPAQVDHVLAGLQSRAPQSTADTSDDTGTIALVLAIAAIVTALGAVTLTITRTHRPMLNT
jgi:hypothetical protein